MIHTVLIVDDYDPLRKILRAEIERNSRWRVVGEASDGDGAVRQAQAHKPDLILLDVGLPVLNGLEAARRILARDPGSRILFLTENYSPDIAAAALGIGARGYLLKVDLARRLLSAMETVVNGGRFLSARLAGEIMKRRREPFAGEERHVAGFYSDEADLLDAYVRFAEAALGAGNALVVVTSERRRRSLHERLQARDVDIDRAVSEGRYVSYAPEAVHAEFMVDGRADEARFRTAAAALIAAAAKGTTGEHRRVSACGECIPALWKVDDPETIVRLEQLWHELATTGGVEVFCGYSLDVTGLRDDDYGVFQRICAAHSTIHVL